MKNVISILLFISSFGYSQINQLIDIQEDSTYLVEVYKNFGRENEERKEYTYTISSDEDSFVGAIIDFE